MLFLLSGGSLANGATSALQLFDTWEDVFPGVEKPAPIDWVLTTGAASGVTVLDAAVISDAQTAVASDHEPVVVTNSIDTTIRLSSM